MKMIVLELDDLDHEAITKAIAKRQSFRMWPMDEHYGGPSNIAGLAVAEICRGWMEFIEIDERREP